MQHKRASLAITAIVLIIIIGVILFSSLYTSMPSSDITVNPSSNNWPMFHHDLNHAGYSTSTAPVSCNLIWNYTAELAYPDGPSERISCSPVVSDGYLYFGGEVNVYCLNASSGERVWIYPTGGYGDTTPAVAGGYVYVGVAALYQDFPSHPNVVCLDALSGSKVWNFTTSSGVIQSSPAVVNGCLYVVCYDGNVYCLDAATGHKKWSYQTGGVGLSSPSVVDGFVYVGSGDGNVNCFNASTGKRVWNYMTGQEKPWEAHAVSSSPAVFNGFVYVGSLDGKVYCLNAVNGEKIWNYTTGSGVHSSPAVASGYVYISSNDDNLYCLNASSGEKIWNYTASATDIPYSGIQSSPAVADGCVYFGSAN
ncbi:MAG: PQQ-binding-like beta-propeller repeat protein [Candidatus Bathyarchaeia archaeon]|jgi:outer membrane protein assembly factor BamB